MSDKSRYTHVQAAVGIPRINRALAQGWEIISASFHDHRPAMVPGQSHIPDIEYVPYALLGLPEGVEPVSGVIEEQAPLVRPSVLAQDPAPIGTATTVRGQADQAPAKPPAPAAAPPQPAAPPSQAAVDQRPPEPAATPRRQSVQPNPITTAQVGVVPTRSEESVVGLRRS